jgi:hypothetical protein
MPRALYSLAGALLLAALPAQVHEVAAQASQAKSAPSGFGIERGEACSGLSPEECCGQALEMAAFRSQGDYLKRPLKTMVQLACRDEHRAVSAQVCRSIVATRGFAADAEAICKPAQRECQKDGTCQRCVKDLVKLDYQGAHNACHALTYSPEAAHQSVLVLKRIVSTKETRIELTRKRK